MKLLLDERNLIVAIGKNIEFGVWGNIGDVASWRITPTLFMADGNFTVEEVNEVPTYVHEGSHYYIDGEFVLNGECPNEYKERIVTLETVTAETKLTQETNDAELLYQVCLLQLGLTEEDL